MSSAAIEEGRYSDALEGLIHLLEMDEDDFFRPDPSVSVFRSVKFAARELLAELPEDARKSYDETYGSRAQRTLDHAIADGSISALQQAARNLPFTSASNQAAYLLALRAMDHGEFSEAEMLLTELMKVPSARKHLEPAVSLNLALCALRLGEHGTANQRGRTLAERFGSKIWSWNDAKLPLQDIATLLQSSRDGVSPNRFDWTMFGGATNRNKMPLASSALGNPTWRNAVVAPSHLRDALITATNHVLDREEPLVSSFFPLILEDLVITRGLDNEIRALDLNSGQLRWRTGFRVPDIVKSPKPHGLSSAGAALEDRLWFDGIGGQLASDGHYVFSVEESWGIETGHGVSSEDSSIVALKSATGMPRNQLSAYDIAAEGKLSWQLKRGDSRLGDHSDVFFLGTPLVLAHSLFVLGELDSGEVRLFALNPNTGDVLYTQYILSNEQSLEAEPLRRLTGVTLAGQGTLVLCPTGSGALVAFDRATRQLLWGYAYEPKSTLSTVNALIVRAANHESDSSSENDRWRISAPRIYGEKILFSPPDSDELHCLKLTDGELLWTLPRDDGLFVAGVQDEFVLVVGKTNVTARSLADGSALWTCPLPKAKLPSGIGYFGREHYFQPLSNKSIVSIELRTGQISDTLSARRGSRPGNLVVTETGIISQTPFGVERFPRLDSVPPALEQATLDVASLAIRAEMRLLAGEREFAIDDLEESLARNATPQARELLLDVYLRGLREDSARFSQLHERIKQLIMTEEEQRRYFLALAQGLEEVGDFSGAFQAYLRIPCRSFHESLVESAMTPVWPGELDLIEADTGVRMNSDTYISWRLQEVQAAAEPKTQEAISDLVKRERAGVDMHSSSQRVKSVATLSRLVRYLPQRDEAAADRLAMLTAEEFDARGASPVAVLRREVLLEELALLPEPELAGPATAQLAFLYRDIQRHDLAKPHVERLANEFAELECVSGLTGDVLAGQLADELMTLAGPESPSSDWPDSAMRVTRGQTGGLVGNEYSVDWEPVVGTALSGWQLRLSTQDNTLIGLDELGRQRFHCRLAPHLRSPRNSTLYYANHAWSRGHLLIYSTGSQVFAIDLLSMSASEEARVLWTLELVQWPAKNASFSFSSTPTDWGEYRSRMRGPDGQPLGNVCLVHAELLCGVRGGVLQGLDPFTGTQRWARSDVQASTSIYGSRKRIYLAKPNAQKADVLDATTGMRLGNRPISIDRNAILARDGKFLIWENSRTVKLSWRDPWSGDAIWETHFAASSKAQALDGEYLVVVHPDWSFQIVRIADGFVVTSGEVPKGAVEKEARLQHVFARRTGKGIIVVAGRQSNRRTADDETHRYPISDGIHSYLLSGLVFGLPGEALEAEPRSQMPAWTAHIEEMSFLRAQPMGVPITTFACSVYDRKDNRLTNHRTEFLLLDTRNGKTVWEDSINGGTSLIRVEATATRDVIRVRSTSTALEVRFAEQIGQLPLHAMRQGTHSVK
ncbi:MAG: PQQ-like beta-propeller repeat protein [Pirellulales bacterium]|nr:PQQ-like beta-propeller repeat protein [Pirellulales bacterium]